MARHFSPSPIPKNIDKWLYDALTRLQTSGEQASAGLAAVARGEVPDGSGGSLVDLSQYFYLPGRQGGQQAYGATESGGFLQLSSTKNGTKGLIYLGSARGSAYDEVNNRLGIGNAAPSGRLHVTGEAPGSLFYRPSAVVIAAGFIQGGTAPPGSLAEVVSDGDTNFIETGSVNPSTTYRLHIGGNDADTTVFPTATANWVFRWQSRKVGASAVTFNWQITDALGVLVTSAVAEAATTSYTPTRTVALTLAQAQQIAAAGTFVQFTVNNFTGLGSSSTTNQWRLTWMEMEVPTGVLGGGSTALFDLANGQTVDNTQWRSSAAAVLSGVTAEGNHYIGDTAGLSGTPLYAKARAATDIVAILRGFTGQTADSFRIQDSTPTTKLAFRAIASETGIDLKVPSAGKGVLRFIPTGAQQAYLDFGLTGDFGPALGVAGTTPCPGTRFSTYVGGAASLSDGYGQDVADAWVLIDQFTTYTFWTPDTVSASRKRVWWQPNGDMENFGNLRLTKFTVGTTGLAATTPGLIMEQAATGTNALTLRPPTNMAASRTQTFLDVTGSVLVDTGIIAWEDDPIYYEDDAVTI